MVLPARAPMLRSTLSPPKTETRPPGATSVVDSTTRGAWATASMSALSSRAEVGSVNWMS